MEIGVYGKEGCKLCVLAKEKLVQLGLNFASHKLADHTSLHEGWRKDSSVEILACYSRIQTMPVITIDGQAMSYPEAIKLLKQVRGAQTRPMPQTTGAEAKKETRELVTV